MPSSLLQNKEDSILVSFFMIKNEFIYRMDGFFSTTDEFMNKGDEVCRHWISKKQICYACQRDRQIAESRFQPVECGNKTTEVQSSFRLDGQQQYPTNIMYSRTLKSDKSSYSLPQTGPNDWQFHNQAPSGYRHPDNFWQKEDPQPVDAVPDPRRFMGNSRDDTRRSEQQQNHKGVMLDRALAMADLLPPSGYQAYFGQYQQQQPTRQLTESSERGTSSRPDRKIEPRTYLDRDLVQPDMRYGNRFFEILPEETRKVKQTNDINTRTNDRAYSSNQIYRTMESSCPLSTNIPSSKN